MDRWVADIGLGMNEVGGGMAETHDEFMMDMIG